MKVTSKTLYSIHFLCALAMKAKSAPQRPVHLREIAEEYHIPFKFLEQIAILMKSVGLVRGARGKAGGYQLAEAPEKISLARIIKATEGEMLPCAQIEGGCGPIKHILGDVFEDSRRLVDEKLDSVTLAEIAEKAETRSEPVYMYYL